MAVNMKGKSLIEINHLSLEEIYQIFDLSRTLKGKQNAGEPHKLLEGKTLGMIFSKPSTRTRILILRRAKVYPIQPRCFPVILTV